MAKLQINIPEGLGDVLSKEELKHVLGGMGSFGSQGSLGSTGSENQCCAATKDVNENPSYTDCFTTMEAAYNFAKTNGTLTGAYGCNNEEAKSLCHC